MKTNRLLVGLAALIFAGLTFGVIGRYGDALAGFLRPDVLIGFGAIATLVALITLEFPAVAPRRAIRVRARTPAGLKQADACSSGIVPLWRPVPEKRKAA
jgi:hypothetical protein